MSEHLGTARNLTRINRRPLQYASSSGMRRFAHTEMKCSDNETCLFLTSSDHCWGMKPKEDANELLSRPMASICFVLEHGKLNLYKTLYIGKKLNDAFNSVHYFHYSPSFCS